MHLRKPGHTSILYYTVMLALTVYFCQQTLHIPDIVAQALLSLSIALGLICMMIVVLTPGRPAFLNVMAVMLLMLWLMWGCSDKFVFSRHLGKMTTLTMLKNSSLFCCMAFVGYRIGIDGKLPDRQKLIAALLVLFIAVTHYVICIQIALINQFAADKYANNGAYCFVSVIPFIVPLINKYKKTAAALLIVCCIFILLSGKRGALICLIISLLAIYYYYLQTHPAEKWKMYLLFPLIIIGGTLIGGYEWLHNELFRNRILVTLEGYSSGRDVIYETLVTTWLNDPDIIHRLFGRGMMQSINIAGNYAHSDWIELLIDGGLISVAVYLIFFITYAHFSFNTRRKIGLQIIFNMNLIITLLFVKSIFSMGLIAIFNSFDMLLLGVLAGNSSRILYPVKPMECIYILPTFRNI